MAWSDIEALEYIASYPDLTRALGLNPAAGRQHYLEHGAAEGRSISFDPLAYVASYPDLLRAIGDNPLAAVSHYIQHGLAEGRVTTFDALDYIASYRDLITAFGTDTHTAEEHYILHGAAEGRTVSFDPLAYVASYGDLIAAIGDNPHAAATHYILHGVAEGRTTTFDPYAYLAANSDLIGAYGDNATAAEEHYIAHGYAEHRVTTFDALDYIASYDDLIAAVGTNVRAAEQHYILHGSPEGRTITFDPVAYWLSRPDLRAAGDSVADARLQWIAQGHLQDHAAFSAFGHEQTSHALTLGNELTSTIDQSGDHDWYQISLTAGQNVLLDMRMLAGGGTPDLAVYDAAGHQVTLATSGLDATSDVVTFQAATSGTYYLVADAGNTAQGAYVLGAALNPSINVGTDGNDTITVSRYAGVGLPDPASAILLSGGAGDDHLTFSQTFTLAVYNQVPPVRSADSLIVQGGDGNDTITVAEVGSSDINGGAGDDYISVKVNSSPQTVTLGSGTDTLFLSYAYAPSQNPGNGIVVTDFAVGVDTIKFDTQLYSGSVNPFATGQFTLVQAGADTLVQERGYPTDPVTTVVTLQNVQASTLTAHDLGFDPHPAPATQSGSESADTLYGSATDDAIFGNGGDDLLSDGVEGHDQLFGGAGNDTLTGQPFSDHSGTLLMDGGIGNDLIIYNIYNDDRSPTPPGNFSSAVALTINGGDGADTIRVGPIAAVTIDAGAGDDSVAIRAAGAQTVTLGAGADTLILDNWFAKTAATPAAAIVVTDFLPGTDKIDLPTYLGPHYTVAQTVLTNWDGVTNPFADGHFRLVQAGADTLLQIDPDGGANSWSTLLTLQHTDVHAFTTHDFGYDPQTGATVAASSALEMWI